MADKAQYDLLEEAAMRDAWQAGRMPECPRCQVPMRRKEIGGGSFGLGYSRKREWLLCPGCRRSVMFDVLRGTRN
jgi:hypothetical protein